VLVLLPIALPPTKTFAVSDLTRNLQQYLQSLGFDQLELKLAIAWNVEIVGRLPNQSPP